MPPSPTTGPTTPELNRFGHWWDASIHAARTGRRRAWTQRARAARAGVFVVLSFFWLLLATTDVFVGPRVNDGLLVRHALSVLLFVTYGAWALRAAYVGARGWHRAFRVGAVVVGCGVVFSLGALHALFSPRKGELVFRAADLGNGNTDDIHVYWSCSMGDCHRYAYVHAFASRGVWGPLHVVTRTEVPTEELLSLFDSAGDCRGAPTAPDGRSMRGALEPCLFEHAEQAHARIVATHAGE